MNLLIKNISELLQVREPGIERVSGVEMSSLPSIKNAFLEIAAGTIKSFGPMAQCPQQTTANVIDASGKTVLPAWCDSHTHLVYAGNRVQEFVDRINGLTYEQITARGGGILNSAQKLHDADEDQIYCESESRLREVMRLGTGAVEIKSGYGLTPENELKMLRVIRRLKNNYPIAVKSTFLGAHAFPEIFKKDHEGYIDQIINEMIPAVAAENLADFIDVFCENGYFSVEQTERILDAGLKSGLRAKIHVNQFNAIGGVQAAVKHNALSVDHLEVMNPEDIDALRNTATMPVALPLCSYFLGIPYTPARDMIAAGLPLAVATDFNPGSTPSGNMNAVVSAACIKMRMTPEEAINAATINAAYAMGLSATHGTITNGKAANLIITKKIESFYELPYSFGSNLIDQVIMSGNIIA